MFGCSGPYDDACKVKPLTYYHRRRCDAETESDVFLVSHCIFVVTVNLSSSLSRLY